MNLTSLHFKILSCLEVNNYSLNELSEILNVSVFKAKRYVNDIGSFFKEEDTLSIHEKLKKDRELWEKLKEFQSFTPKERESYVVMNFFKNNIINLTSISERFSVTRRTLSNDIQNLKKELEFFSLKIVGYNSYGISLEGDEKNKREFFELYFLKLFIEEKYLPKEFENFFLELNEIKKKYKVSKIVDMIYKVCEKWEMPRNTYTILHIEILIYLAIIREDFEDESVKVIDSSIDLSKYVELNEILEKIEFFSNYERDSVKKLFLKRKKMNFFQNNREEVLELRNFIDYLSKVLKMEIPLNDDLLMRLTIVLNMMKIKRLFNIVEIYIFNNQVAEDYFNKFKLVSNLVKKYYKNIDSFDRTILSMTILNEINKDVERKIENLKNIVVVYNFLNIGLVKDICEEFKIEKLMENMKFVSYRELDYFIEINSVKGIVLFEDIKLNKKYNGIKQIKFNLPVTKLDKFKLSVFLKKEDV